MEKKELLSILKSKGYSPERVGEFFKSVSNSGNSFRDVFDDLTSIREVVLWVVGCNGRALEYTLPEFKNDKEVVMAAVINDVHGLAYANDLMKGDRDVLLMAVSFNGSAIKYASQELCDDEELVEMAISKSLYGNVLSYASARLINKPSVVLSALLKANKHERVRAVFKDASDELKSVVGSQDPIVVLKSMVSKDELSLKLSVGLSNKKGLKI